MLACAIIHWCECTQCHGYTGFSSIIVSQWDGYYSEKDLHFDEDTLRHSDICIDFRIFFFFFCSFSKTFPHPFSDPFVKCLGCPKIFFKWIFRWAPYWMSKRECNLKSKWHCLKLHFEKSRNQNFWPGKSHAYKSSSMVLAEHHFSFKLCIKWNQPVRDTPGA